MDGPLTVLVGGCLVCISWGGRALSLCVTPFLMWDPGVEKGCSTAACIHCSLFLIVGTKRPDVSSTFCLHFLSWWPLTVNQNNKFSLTLLSSAYLITTTETETKARLLRKYHHCNKMADWQLWDEAGEPLFLRSPHLLSMLLLQDNTLRSTSLS